MGGLRSLAGYLDMPVQKMASETEYEPYTPAPYNTPDDDSFVKHLRTQAEPTDEQTPDCACGLRARWFLIKNERSPHVGKYFFCCSKPKEDACPFWELLGGRKWTPVELAPDGITCHCRKPAKLNRQKKEGKNQGRAVYSCATGGKNKCNFFRWGPPIA